MVILAMTLLQTNPISVFKIPSKLSLGDVQLLELNHRNIIQSIHLLSIKGLPKQTWFVRVVLYWSCFSDPLWGLDIFISSGYRY